MIRPWQARHCGAVSIASPSSRITRRTSSRPIERPEMPSSPKKNEPTPTASASRSAVLPVPFLPHEHADARVERAAERLEAVEVLQLDRVDPHGAG